MPANIRHVEEQHLRELPARPKLDFGNFSRNGADQHKIRLAARAQHWRALGYSTVLLDKDINSKILLGVREQRRLVGNNCLDVGGHAQTINN